MRVVLHHPALIPPKDYGGTERVVLWLARGLIEMGHEVWVVAKEGSRLTPGANLISIDPSDRNSSRSWIQKIPSNVDVVHFHAPASDADWNGVQCAKVTTIHGNGKLGEKFRENSVFLSQDHAKRHGSQLFVYNGLDPLEYRFLQGAEKSNAALFLANTNWRVKNLRGAMRIAKSAHTPLWIAGGNRPLSCRLQTSFESLRGHHWRWLGRVNGETKAKALAQARVLLFPVIWSEPFGLAVIEALVSGTPVIASSLGSLPEIVTPSVGAVLSHDDPAAWVDLLSRSSLPWSAEACRERVMTHFHYHKMTSAYVSIYQNVIKGKHD